MAVGHILKLFCVVLPVGYCEVMFLCLSFFVALSPGPRPAFHHLQKAGRGLGTRPLPLYCTASDGKLGEDLEARLRFLTVRLLYSSGQCSA